MEFLLSVLPAGGGGAVAAAAAAVGGVAAAAALAEKAGIVRMGQKDRSNAPPGEEHLTQLSSKCVAGVICAAPFLAAMVLISPHFVCV
jgi:ent-kaurene oxidase